MARDMVLAAGLAGSLRKGLAVVLLAVGAVLVGQGLYIHAKAWLAQVLLARAFEESVAARQPVKPWSWADTWPVARISVPRLAVSEIALAGGSGQALAFGPGHLDHTADPGEPGTVVYAAHRDTHFHFLRDLVPGDVIEVMRSDGEVYRYRAVGTSVVRWDSSGIEVTGQGQRLVLATCWPFEARTPGPLRYLVHAEAMAR